MLLLGMRVYSGRLLVGLGCCERSKQASTYIPKPRSQGCCPRGDVRCKLVYDELGAAEVVDVVVHVGSFELPPLEIVLGHVLYERRHDTMLMVRTWKYIKEQ